MWTALALAAIAFGSGAAPPPDAPKKAAEPDEELLEFLGTVDSAADATTQPDDGSWIEYLSQTDIDKAAKKAKAPGQPDTKPGAPKVKSDEQ